MVGLGLGLGLESSSMSAFFLSSPSFFCDTLIACSSLLVSACRLSEVSRHCVSFFLSSSSRSRSLSSA